MFRRSDLLSKVKDEYDLLQRLGGIRPADKTRLYSAIADPGESARYMLLESDKRKKAKRSDQNRELAARLVRARDFVRGAMERVGATVRRGGHITRWMNARLGNSMQKIDGLLFFERRLASQAFDVLIELLVGEKLLAEDRIRALAAQKHAVLEEWGCNGPQA